MEWTDSLESKPLPVKKNVTTTSNDTISNPGRKPEAILKATRLAINVLDSSFKAYRAAESGHIIFKYTISPNGKVIAAKVIESSWECKNLDAEMLETIKAMKFDTISKGNVTVTYTFNFGEKADSAVRYYTPKDYKAAYSELKDNEYMFEYLKNNDNHDDPQSEECEFKISDMYYRAESKLNLINRENFEKVHKAWYDSGEKNKEPLAPIFRYDSTIKWHAAYIKHYPKNGKRIFVKYRLGAVYDMIHNESGSIQLMKDIADSAPDFKSISAVYCRLAEYYYSREEYKSALDYYRKNNSLPSSKKMGTKEFIERIKQHENVCQNAVRK